MFNKSKLSRKELKITNHLRDKKVILDYSQRKKEIEDTVKEMSKPCLRNMEQLIEEETRQRMPVRSPSFQPTTIQIHDYPQTGFVLKATAKTLLDYSGAVDYPIGNPFTVSRREDSRYDIKFEDISSKKDYTLIYDAHSNNIDSYATVNRI